MSACQRKSWHWQKEMKTTWLQEPGVIFLAKFKPSNCADGWFKKKWGTVDAINCIVPIVGIHVKKLFAAQKKLFKMRVRILRRIDCSMAPVWRVSTVSHKTTLILTPFPRAMREARRCTSGLLQPDIPGHRTHMRKIMAVKQMQRDAGDQSDVWQHVTGVPGADRVPCGQGGR